MCGALPQVPHTSSLCGPKGTGTTHIYVKRNTNFVTLNAELHRRLEAGTDLTTSRNKLPSR